MFFLEAAELSVHSFTSCMVVVEGDCIFSIMEGNWLKLCRPQWINNHHKWANEGYGETHIHQRRRQSKEKWMGKKKRHHRLNGSVWKLWTPDNKKSHTMESIDQTPSILSSCPAALFFFYFFFPTNLFFYSSSHAVNHVFSSSSFFSLWLFTELTKSVVSNFAL